MHLFDDLLRDAILSRFPYEIIYLVDNIKSEVYIIAISHQHRKTSWFSKRI